MKPHEEKILSFAPVILKLLRGPLYDDDHNAWQELITHQHGVRNYFASIGIELILNERDGFAFVRQYDEDELENVKLPRLTQRIPLTYEVTLLCVLLREWLEEFDVKDTDSKKLFVTQSEIKDRLDIFFKDQANRAKLYDKLDVHINRVENLGFLTAVPNTLDPNEPRYEVRRILRAKIDNEKLQEIKERLEEYAKDKDGRNGEA